MRADAERSLRAATRSMSTKGDTMAFTPTDRMIIDAMIDGGDDSTPETDDALIDEVNQ